MGIFDKAKEMAAGKSDKVDAIVDRAGDLVDEKTGGKHAARVDQGQDFLRGQYGGSQAEPPPADAPPADVHPTEARPADAPAQESFQAPADPAMDATNDIPVETRGDIPGEPPGDILGESPAQEGAPLEENPPV